MDLALETSTSPAVVTDQQHGKPQTHASTVLIFNLEFSQDANIIAE